MRRVHLAPVFGAALAWAGAAQAEDLNHLLKGTFSITGTQICIVSPAGFNRNQTPKGPSFVTTNSIIGTRTFNGDGTGSDEASDVSVTLPPVGSATSGQFSFNLTYAVGPDLTVTSQNEGPLTGTELSGVRAGQTFTVDHFSFTGKLSQDHRSLTQASPAPEIEVVTFSNGDVQPRICNRSRILIKVDDNTDDTR